VGVVGDWSLPKEFKEELKMRYFVRFDGENKPIMLYRFNLDVANSISEERWLNDSRTWSDSDSTIVEALVTGSMEYDEIAEDLAKQLFPSAFES